MRRSVSILLACSMVVLGACTEAGETTGRATATGGVMGAGLGAVIGNQVGDTGAGLVIGAAAGSAAGAMVGNALEAQDQAINMQDEAIERQQQIIASQKREIEELRRMGQDSVQYKPASTYKSEPRYKSTPESDYRNSDSKIQTSANWTRPSETLAEPENTWGAEQAAPIQASAPAVKFSNEAVIPEKADVSYKAETVHNRSDTYSPGGTGLEPLSRGSFGTRNAYAAQTDSKPEMEGSARASYSWKDQNEEKKESAKNVFSAECQKAKGEIDSAYKAREYADKLYHYKRALRLCPESTEYHNGLGEVYRSLNRTEDARYEFQEALRISPENEVASKNLASLN